MPKIMSMPLVYQDREWQTIVSIYPLQEELHLRVNILNNKLARKLGSSNLFIYKNGNIFSYTDKNDQSTLQFTVQKMLSSYIDYYTV